MFVEAAGRRIDARWIPARVAGAPTLVFLHEGLGSIGLWRDFPQTIAEQTGFSALVYSRYGNGRSEVLQAARDVRYMHDEALVSLPEVLDRFHIERALLVGHSDGASIALLYAAEYPLRVAAVVVEAPHVFVEEVSVSSIAAIGQQYRNGVLRERMARHHDDVDATFFGWNDIWLHPSFLAWNIEACLERIVAPVLCIQGAQDEYGTLAQVDAITRHAQVPVDRVILDGCGHSPHRDRANVVAPILAGWAKATVQPQ
ncbi:MAG: alpha/beta fold hydrolase [Vulcanimicrobiaceae bacterium]